MKIAIFSDNFYPEISGISDSIIMTARELAKRRHKIYFFVPEYSTKDYKYLGLNKKEIFLHRNIKVFRIKSIPFPTSTNQGRFVLPFFGFKELEKFNPDVIHSHMPFGTGLKALYASKKLKIPLIGTNHTYMPAFIKNKNLGKLLERYNQWYYNQCDFISAPTKYRLNFMKNRNKKIPSGVISNPISLKRYKLSVSEKHEIIKKYDLKNFNIVYCGRFSPEKKVEVILYAISLLKDKIPSFKLLLIGKGSTEEKLRKLSEKLKIKDKIRFTGFLNKKQISKIYNLCDIFVTACDIETQPLSVLEAMANYLPVIGVNSGGLKELIDSKTGKLVKPDNPREFSREIYFLFKDLKKKKELGVNAHIFSKRFSPEKIATKWEKIYQRFTSKL